jgi:hypothetical protein
MPVPEWKLLHGDQFVTALTAAGLVPSHTVSVEIRAEVGEVVRLTYTDLADAWREYLEETRGLEPGRYDEVEAHAWVRLQQKLRKLRLRARRAAA